MSGTSRQPTTDIKEGRLSAATVKESTDQSDRPLPGHQALHMAMAELFSRARLPEKDRLRITAIVYAARDETKVAAGEVLTF